MSKSTLTSIAILKVNWEQGRSYLDSFVPFVAECVRVRAICVVDAAQVQAHLDTDFGLLIPQHVVSRILKRAKKRGYLKSERGRLVPNQSQLPTLAFRATQDSVLRMYEDITTSFVAFCRDRFSIAFTEEDAAAALLAFLEEYHLPIVASRIDGSIVPPIERKVTSAKFLVGAFIRHLEQSRSPRMEAIDILARGIMVANAIFLPDPDQANKAFGATQVFFDTAFLIYALGYAGEPRCAPCRELLQLLYTTGARLRCFAHTFREVRESLDACASRIATAGARAATGPILPSIEYFLARGFTSSDIFLLSARLETDLANLRIRLVDKPPYAPEFVIDEKQFGELLDTRLGYRSPQARDRDVDSISAIVRFLQGRPYYMVEDSPAVFVTTNGRLVRQATLFFFQDAPRDAIAPFLTDQALTNLLWLKRPNAAPDLPRQRIIADCYAATEPDDRLWSKYVTELAKLESLAQISADDYFLLRYDLEARVQLMDRTRGDPQRFYTDTVPDILHTIRTRIRADLVQEVSAQTGRAATAETALRQSHAERLAQLSRIEGRAIRLARVTVRVFQIAIAAAFCLCTALAFPPGLPPFYAAPVRYTVSAVAALVSVLSISSLVLGTSLSSAFRRLEVALAAKIQEQLVAFAGITRKSSGA